MSAFEPINPDHAIAAVAFLVMFNRQLNPTEIARAREIEPTVKEFLPGIQTIEAEPPPGFPHGVPFSPVPIGIIFQRVKPDATPAWLLTAQQNFINAQCMEYSRWVEVWGRVRAWLSQLYDRVKGTDLFITAVTLQYKDQFSATKPLDSDVLPKLFRVDTEYLPPRTFQNKDLWHVHQGWYLPVTEPVAGHKFTVLNIATREAGNSIVLMIDHMSRYNMDSPGSSLFTDGGGPGPIDVIMEDLHGQNKSLLRDLLSLEMAERIRLDS